MGKSCVIVVLTLVMAFMSSCSWVRSHLAPQRKGAELVETVRLTHKRAVDAEANGNSDASPDSEQAANSIVPTDAQREEARKLIAEMHEENAVRSEDEVPNVQNSLVLPLGKTRMLERSGGEGTAEENSRSLPDPAEQRGLRSPGLPKVLPMDIDGKLHNS